MSCQHKLLVSNVTTPVHPKRFNAYHAASVSRRQVQNCTTFSKKVKFIELHYYIWNRCGKCIQISTNMPSIGSVNCVIAFEI